MTTASTCGLCGEPMPPGEEMFKYHGYSGDCPKPPLKKPPALDGIARRDELLRRALRQLSAWQEKYGAWQPQWLPPAGDVRLAEDIDEVLTPNAQVKRQAREAGLSA